jgi:hypothetical protein
MDRLSGRSRDEGCGGQVKRSVGKGTTRFKENNYTSTSLKYDNHFGSQVVILRSGEYEGSKEYPSTTFGTAGGRRSNDNR